MQKAVNRTVKTEAQTTSLHPALFRAAILVLGASIGGLSLGLLGVALGLFVAMVGLTLPRTHWAPTAAGSRGPAHRPRTEREPKLWHDGSGRA